MANIERLLKTIRTNAPEKVETTSKQTVQTPSSESSVMSSVQSKDTRDKTLIGGYNDLMSAMDDIAEDVKPRTYNVKRGDTLSMIAKRQGVSLSDLIKANPGINPDVIKSGQTINLPFIQKDEVAQKQKDVLSLKLGCGFSDLAEPEKKSVQPQIKPKTTNNNSPSKVHVVKKGDTLAMIARNNGVSLAELLRANPGINVNIINIGQKVKLPNAAPKPVAAPTPAQAQAKPQAAQSSAASKMQTQDNSVYTVKKGDTLWQVAQDHNITVSELKSANNMGKIQYLSVGQKLNIPKPIIKSDMDVDPGRAAEYKASVAGMMRAKGVTNEAEIQKLSTLITNKSLEMKVDPVLIGGIIGQEVDFRYMSDNIWGRNGKGMMQLTYTTVSDLYRCKPGVADCYKGSRDNVLKIMQKYKTPDDLYKAICQKNNYELNLEVGIIIFKAKMEEDYVAHPKWSERQHIENSVRNYNGNVEKRASGIEIRDEYRNKIMKNYDNYKLA